MTDPFWGEPIHSYSRKQAIEDGVLVDVTALAKEAGIRYPTAVTASVWQEYVIPDAQSRQLGQSVEGRLWDVLFLLAAAVLRGAHGSEVNYKVTFVFGGDRQEEVPLKAVCGPGDDASPCITIMKPDED